MKCYQCGHEMDENGQCGNCGAASQVRVMSREEKASYDGITIEEDTGRSSEDGPRFYKRSVFDDAGVRIHSFHLGQGNRNWVNLVLGGIIIAAVLAFLFFVALPVVLVLVAVAVVVYVVLSFFQGL